MVVNQSMKLKSGTTRFGQLKSAIRFILSSFCFVSIVQMIAGGVSSVKKVIDRYFSTHSHPSTQRHFVDMIKLMINSVALAFSTLRTSCIWIANELVGLYRTINSAAIKYTLSMHSEVNLKLANRLISQGTNWVAYICSISNQLIV
jgi:hypothetical protein